MATHVSFRYSAPQWLGWVPGDWVIDLGADGLSRSEGQDWGGYGLNPSAWKLVCNKAESAGKKLTIDLFASASNAKCQRFHSFHHSQGAESADTFDRLSWAHSECPCGQTHSEFVYAFPQMDLLLPCGFAYKLTERPESPLCPCPLGPHGGL